MKEDQRRNTRAMLTVEEQAFEIFDRRFNSKRPSDEELGKARFTGGEPVKRAVKALFDRLDGKLDAKKFVKLKEAFDCGINIWEQAGLFTQEREKAGYLKPDFERDYQHLLTQEILDMTKEGEDLNRGYSAPVFAPKDVPFYDKDPSKLSYIKLLKDVLFRVLCGTAGGKQPNTLLVGPEKHIVTANQIRLGEMLSIDRHFLIDGVLFDVNKLSDYSRYPRVNMYDDVSEKESLERLRGNEKRTGGVMRFERNRLIMPRDIDKKPNMDAMSFETNLPRLFPNYVEAQDIKQACAHIIYCLETHGWVPDVDLGCDTTGTHKMNLAIKNCVMGATGSGEPAVPMLGWSMHNGQFTVGIHAARHEFCIQGVRVGIRMRDCEV